VLEEPGRKPIVCLECLKELIDANEPDRPEPGDE
jgi:hypothetical protein